MANLNERELINMVEKRYFGSVDNKLLESVMDCFNPDATLTIQTDNLSHFGIDEIRRMFSDFFESFKTIWHGEFQPIVDVERQSLAVQFVATRDTFDDEHQRASNCNFFAFRNRKIQSITIYMSDKNPLV